MAFALPLVAKMGFSMRIRCLCFKKEILWANEGKMKAVSSSVNYWRQTLLGTWRWVPNLLQRLTCALELIPEPCWERWKSRFPKSSLNVSRRLYFMISTTSLASCWLAFSRISSRARAFKGRFEQGNKKDVNMTSKLKLMRFPDVWWRACVPLNWVANCE